MSKTNTLTSHNGESRVHPVNKMSGVGYDIKKDMTGLTRKYIKRFTNRKRRMMLKNPLFFDKF